MERDIPPSAPVAPKTEGRKKIRIARIQDTRSRQVTFLKRKNGLLKKAMELGILCDCEVSVIIFNTSNGKLFEYSSVEMEKVLQRYATYSGPSERRKRQNFFDLAKAKGNCNIPLNEPHLAQAAMEAAAVAVKRPRPTYKFSTEGNYTQNDTSGRKLSSGESPAGPYHALPSPDMAEIQPNKRQKMLAPNSSGAMESGAVHPIQLLNPTLGRPSFISFEPRFSAAIPVPALTPHSASRQLSDALGLEPTPRSARPMPMPVVDTSQGLSTYAALQAAEQCPTSLNMPSSAKPPQQPFQPMYRPMPLPSATTTAIAPKPFPHPHTIGTFRQEKSQSGSPDVDRTFSLGVLPLEPPLEPAEYMRSHDTRPARQKPNLRVKITSPNRDDIVAGTPSGINSLTTPSSGDDNLLGNINIPRLTTGISPANSGWPPWNSLGTERDGGPVALSPFLHMDSLSGPHDIGGTAIALPSPTDAGLIPITPRGFGLESLLSSRAPSGHAESTRSKTETTQDNNRSTDPRRPFT